MSRSLMGKFQREVKSNKTRWADSLSVYRASKRLSRLIDKYSLKGLSELIEFTINYISGVEGLHIKPNKEFIDKVNKLNDKGII